MLLTLTFAVCLATVLARCPVPSAVEKGLRFQECRPGQPNYTLKVLNLTVTDLRGSQKYPVDLSQPLMVNIVVANHGRIVRDILSDTTVQVYTSVLWFPCAWRTLPTLGLLSNIRGCVGCPIQQGITKLTMPLYPSTYRAIISMLSSGTAYAVTAVARDGDDPAVELSCLRIEGLIDV
uniref:Uncharacterized protein n=1 Tax=Trichuris muris TaxID=70415 RepID=A0A5S6Q501_TRIMR